MPFEPISSRFTSLTAGTRHLLAQTLAMLEQPAEPAGLAEPDLQPVVWQWLAVLEAAGLAELEGLTNDLRTLAEALTDTLPANAFLASNCPAQCRTALHRVGLSVQRVAVLGGSGPLPQELMAIGQRLLKLSAERGGK